MIFWSFYFSNDFTYNEEVFMVETMDFNIKSYENLLFKTDKWIIVNYQKDFFHVQPYFTVDSITMVTSVEVGFNIIETKFDELENKYSIKLRSKDSEKKYKLPTALIKEIVNIEASIVEAVLKQNKRFASINIVYDKEKTYLRMQNINNKFREYLKSFLELPIDFDTVKLGQSVSRQKLLMDFKKELIESTKINEQSIQHTFKKYRDILSLVLLGVDSTLTFEFRIENDDTLTNKVDIASTLSSKAINLIELKKADAIMFDKTNLYRNNTLSPTKQFSSAIQQTNVQRAFLSKITNDIFNTVSKSVLIFGNSKQEFVGHIYEKELKENLAILKYNNKDITIMTYDEILDRIDLLIGSPS